VSETLTIAAIGALVAIVGSILTFHIGRQRLQLEWRSASADVAAKFQQMALAEAREREELETRLEAGIAKLQFDRNSLRERLEKLQNEYESALKTWQQEREALLVAMDGQRNLRVSARSPVEISMAKLRLPLAQRADYSHFSVVRTKLHWSGGFAGKR